MKKKVTSWVLAICMMITMLPATLVSASAFDIGAETHSIKISATGNTITATGTGGAATQQICIIGWPSKYAVGTGDQAYGTIINAITGTEIYDEITAEALSGADKFIAKKATGVAAATLDASAQNGEWTIIAYSESMAANRNSQVATVASAQFVEALAVTAGSSPSGWTVDVEVPETTIATISGGSATSGEYKSVRASSGTLPAGMTLGLDGSNVVISGTPAAYAASGATITVEVTDQSNATATANVTLSAVAKGTPVVASVATVSGSSGTVNYTACYTIKDSKGNDISGDVGTISYSGGNAGTTGGTANDSAGTLTGVTAAGTLGFNVSSVGSTNWGAISNEAVSATVTYASYTINYVVGTAANASAVAGGATVAGSGTPGIAGNAAANGFTMDGYDFAGWKVGNTATIIAAGNSIPGSDTLADGGSITLTATWTPKQPLTFNAGTLTGTFKVGTPAESSAMSAPTGGSTNPSSGAVVYTIKSCSNGTATITSGNKITLNAAHVGSATIVVTATDPNGQSADANMTINGITEGELAIVPNMAVSGTTSDSFTLADFITSVSTLYTADTKEGVFNDAISALVTGAFGPTKGITIKFYDDATYTTTTVSDTLTALPTAAGTYYYSVEVTASASVNADYKVGAGAAENKTGVLTLTTPPAGGGVSAYTVTYDVGEHGKLAEGAKRTESVNYKKSPKSVPQVVANEGYKFLGWSLDGKTVVEPTEQKITKRTTFTALYEEAAKTLAFDKELNAPYIKGIVDDNGTVLFKPEASLTRGEVAAIIARTLTIKMEDGKTYYNGQFPDVKGDEWYAEYAGFLADMGVVKGLEDGTFGADKVISRAEFVTMIVRVDGVLQGENSFADVASDHWAYEFIVSASNKNIVKGYEDGLFYPQQNINRASSVTIINRVLGWTFSAEGEMVFSDVAADHWAYSDIIRASNGRQAQ